MEHRELMVPQVQVDLQV